MISEQEILKAYASADEEQRLYMFLSHRDLREEFGSIDLRRWREGNPSAESVATA